MTASSAPKSTYGSTCTCWNRSVSVWPTLVTLPIGIPFGYSELNAPARQPAVTISCPTPNDVLLAHTVEHERLARAARVAHDPGRAGAQVDGRGGGLLVGEELDPRGSEVTRVTTPTRPSAVTTGSLSARRRRSPRR